MKVENTTKPTSGVLMVIVVLAIVAVEIALLIMFHIKLGWTLLGLAVFLSTGFIIANPNDSSVLVLFGDYKVTIKENGFFWVNPLMNKKRISLRARNFDSSPIKVNDKLGNPIMIGGVLVWKVSDTFKSSFEVDEYETFVKIQNESAIRKLAGLYPYDSLAYASEIAGAMLQHQQAIAIVAARQKIVEGAVGMVETALE